MPIFKRKGDKELAAAAAKIWRIVRANGEITREEVSTMRFAYAAGVLPYDADCSPAQWVEDGCPCF